MLVMCIVSYQLNDWHWNPRQLFLLLTSDENIGVYNSALLWPSDMSLK